VIVRATLLLAVLFASTVYAGAGPSDAKSSTVNRPEAVYLFPPKSIPNVFRPTSRWIKRLFGVKQNEIKEYQPYVVTLELDRLEVVQACTSDVQRIKVSTTVDNRAADVITYHYYVSGAESWTPIPEKILAFSGFRKVKAGPRSGIYPKSLRAPIRLLPPWTMAVVPAAKLKQKK